MQLTARSLFIGSFVLVLGGLAGGFWLSRQQPGLLDFAATGSAEAKAVPRAIEPRTDLGGGEKGVIRLFEESAPSVAFITSAALEGDYFSRAITETPIGAGTGFVWDRDGHIITNFHVLELQQVDQAQWTTEARAWNVTLSDRSSWEAKLVGVAPDKDLAVLKIDAPAEKLRPLPLGNSSELRVGQSVYAIGNPFGYDQSLTTGIISALGREIRSPLGIPIRDVIQTDAAINPGNSGGPLLDSAGRLIGVNTQISSPTGASAGIGFAIPSDTVNWVVPELVAYGRIRRPNFGIEFVPAQIAQRWGVTEGLVVRIVVARGPAAKAGIRPIQRNRRGQLEGDILLSVDGTKMKSEGDLWLALERKKPGDTIAVTIKRADKEYDLQVTLGEPPREQTR